MPQENKTQNAIKLEELQQKHNARVAHVEVNGKLYVFRAPSLEEWEDHQERLMKAPRRGPVLRELAQITLAHPSLEELQELFAVYPGIMARIGDAVAELAGADIELTVKKG